MGSICGRFVAACRRLDAVAFLASKKSLQQFFATTFKKGAYGVPRQVNDKGGASFRFFEVDELKDLLLNSGFSSVDVEVVGAGCLMARCEK